MNKRQILCKLVMEKAYDLISLEFFITWKVWFQGEMPFMDFVSTIHGLCVYYAALSLGEWNS